MKKFRKVFFPIGIFLMIAVIQSAAVLVALSAYFIHTGKKRISDIESYTRNYSITMAEGFAGLSEFSSRAKNYKYIKELFQEKLRENTVDEAFFVLPNGKILVHSNKDAEKNLEGNIANDEFLYNLDVIFMPLKKKSKEVFFQNYNYIGKEVPFERDDRMLLKKYLYEDIDKSGWIVVRGVYNKNKPAGSLVFIISKERIFSFLKLHIAETYRMINIALAASISVSFIISIIVFVRYRMIEKRAVKFSSSGISEPGSIKENVELFKMDERPDKVVEMKVLHREEKTVDKKQDNVISIELLAEIDDEPDFSVKHHVKNVELSGDDSLKLNREVKDPIPLAKKVS